MPAEFASAIAFLAGTLFAMISSCLAVAKGSRLQQEILERGALAQGRVLKLWRPPLLGAFTRVYFEFEPSAERGAVRTCHVDRRVGEPTASLPAVGTRVAVRYLPEAPTRAVIARLVARRID